MKHHCGVFGVFGHPEAVQLAYLGLYSQQHRGQESAGICSCDRGLISRYAGMGLVTEVFDAACEGRIKALYLMGENPMLSDPNLTHVEEALRAVEFLAVQDIFLNETAQLADVVLPAASFAEKEGTFTNTERRVQLIRPALDVPGSARPDWAIITDLANRLAHPRYGHEKEYRVLLAKRPDQEQLEAWRRGVVLDDGHRTAPVDVRYESSQGKGAWVRVVMREGRKRQIRETCQQLALPVVRILRTRIGTLRLGNLKPRQWRYLTTMEVNELKNGETPKKKNRR